MSRTLDDRRSHWDSIWSTRRPEETSWFEAIPERSADEIQRCAVGDSRAPDVGLIDVGGGASTLVDVLLDRGFNDLTVLDVSGKALDASRRRLGIRSDSVSWIVADVLAWQPDRTFQIWHDRAVLHFLRTPDEIDAYINLAASALVEGGHLVVSVFGPDGPESCSGLPARRWSAAELSARCVESFRPLRSVLDDHVTPSGTRQQFMTIVLERIASGTQPREKK